MPDQKHFKEKLESYSIHDLEVSKKTADVSRSSGEMKWASMHHHSTFSYLDGYGTPEQHVNRAAELGMPALAMTEHGNVSSHARFERAAQAAGIKPVFGVEAYCGPVEEEKRGKRKNHLTLLAEDATGYRNLLRLVERSYAEGFYYEPTIDGRILVEHRKGLVVLSGCLGSLFATSIVGGKNVPEHRASLARGLKVAEKFKRSFNGSYYIEVQPFPTLEKTCAVNQAAEEIAKKLGIPLVATGDVHYTLPEENEMQQILHNVRGGTRQTLEQQAQAWGYDVELCHPSARKALYQALRATGLSKRAASEAIDNSLEIAERCNVTLPKGEKLRYPTPPGQDNKSLWREWLRDGWKYRECHRLPKKTQREYVRRIKHEMKIIEDKDFIDYFLVVSDAVRWAKDHGVPVGPARGSAAGSLVCWLLRITEVNPMLFPNLVFERFIDVSREDEPDIDLDFDDELRDQVRAYLVDKYGQDKVANIATFVYYKSKNSLDDVARVFRIPQWEVDKVKDLVIERSGGDLRASATIEDTVEMFDVVKEVFDNHPDLYKSQKLEGNIKGMGVHAAGLVVSNQPVRELAPVHRRTVKGEVIDVLGVDKFDAELIGLLKMDFLGLKTMGMIRIALEYLGMSLDDLYALPLDDPETIQGFRENDVVGIFQFDGNAIKDINGAIKPDSFEEICHVNALARPGPLHNGATRVYIGTKWGSQEPRKLHPLYDRITKDTHYEIVYQEQILRIVTEIGGFDWTHAAYIRRLISRRMGEQEFNRQRSRFMKGAKKNGFTEKQASEIWGNCITAGAYAFNAAHSVSYGMLAYWSMWLKRHHPKVFYAAALRKYENKQTKLLRDAVAHGLEIYPPHPLRSQLTWKPVKKGLRAGLVEIPGIGEKTAESIAEFRDSRKGEKIGWSDLQAVRGIGPVTINKITEFVEAEDPLGVYTLQRSLDSVRKALKDGELGDLPVPTHRAIDVPYTSGEDVPVVWCGVLLHRNLRDLFELNMARTGEPLNPEEVRRPDLREWVNMVGEDEDEIIYIVCNRYTYPRYKNMIWNITPNKDVILVKGIKRGFLTKRDILVQDMWTIEP